MSGDVISSELELLAKQNLARALEIELEMRLGGVAVGAAPSFRIEMRASFTAEAKAILARLPFQKRVDDAQHGILEPGSCAPVRGRAEPAGRAGRKTGTSR